MNKPHLHILTGASRGLGAAIARALLVEGHELICVSRGSDDDLATAAAARRVALQQWTLDLADPPAAAQRLAGWLQQQPAARYGAATLINNAALIATPGPLQDVPEAELSAALRVGLEAPMQLTRAFLRATAGWGVERRVLNISSGLGRRAMAGQAAYCAVKAGMDHFTRCVALDEARLAGGARIVSLAPGVIDTDMQRQLRGSDAQAFPDAGVFRQMHESGRLDAPEAAAAKVVAYLRRADFGAQPVADVRDAA